MSAAIVRILTRASAAFVVEIDAFVQVALFSGVGLLMSLSVLILDQQFPANGFEILIG